MSFRQAACTIFLTCLVAILGACSRSPSPASSLTPTASSLTPTATSPTAPPGITQLPFVGNGDVTPSPDGALLAFVPPPSTTLTVYTLGGLVRGRFNVPAGHQVFSAGWMPDSSGLFVADVDPSAAASAPAPPLLLLTPDGTTKPTGLDAGANGPGEVVVSPDNQWIADAAQPCGTCNIQVELAPRAGGTTHVLPPGGTLALGWQSGRLIYYNGGQNAIDAYDPHDGSSRFVTSGLPRTTDGSDTFDNPLYHQDAGLSPDGQVLVVRTSRYQMWVLSGSRLQHAPPFIVDASIYWVGLGHAALGETRGGIAVIDVLSGAVQRATGIAGTNVYAMAGDWAVVSVNAGGAYFHVINYTTGADHPLGGYAGDGVQSSPSERHASCSTVGNLLGTRTSSTRRRSPDDKAHEDTGSEDDGLRAAGSACRTPTDGSGSASTACACWCSGAGALDRLRALDGRHLSPRRLRLRVSG